MKDILTLTLYCLLLLEHVAMTTHVHCVVSVLSLQITPVTSSLLALVPVTLDVVTVGTLKHGKSLLNVQSTQACLERMPWRQKSPGSIYQKT
jgi:uncharacterized membrane protein YfhO